MRKVYVDDLEPGLVLGRTLYNDWGHVLLSKGVTFTQRYIEALRAFGFYAVYVMDGTADDVEPPDVLGDRVRLAAYKSVQQIFGVAQGGSIGQSGEPIRSPLSNLATTAGPALASLYRSIEQIIDKAMDSRVLSGVGSLKSHDRYAFEHSVEVAVAGVILGIRHRLGETELRQLAMGCLCHDIGKVLIPREILDKTGPLTEAEEEELRRHPDEGYKIMQQVSSSEDIVARHIVWQHHERQDGSGYPRGLKGTNLYGHQRKRPFGLGLMLPMAEIAAVANVYCALASDQPRRKALPPAQVATSLKRMAGTHLNRDIVGGFLSVFPTYPVGDRVSLRGGDLQGHAGVVTAINSGNVNRPMVRVLFSPDGESIPQFEVDTSQDPELEILEYDPGWPIES